MILEKFGDILRDLSAVFKGIPLPYKCGFGIEWFPFCKLRGDNLADLLIGVSGKEGSFLPFPYKTGEKRFMACLEPEGGAVLVHIFHIIKEAGGSSSA